MCVCVCINIYIYIYIFKYGMKFHVCNDVYFLRDFFQVFSVRVLPGILSNISSLYIYSLYIHTNKRSYK